VSAQHDAEVRLHGRRVGQLAFEKGGSSFRYGTAWPSPGTACSDRSSRTLVTGNTDAHLKNWALSYPDGRTPHLAPVYDFHSLTVYATYRYQPLALSFGGERLPEQIRIREFQQLAQFCGHGAEWTADVVADAVNALRTAWLSGSRDETRSRFPALADHFERRMRELPICTTA
jgi:serine/threonine-protein kinase HipA